MKRGDRQAALRFGLELPTGQKGAPSEQQLQAPRSFGSSFRRSAAGFLHADLTYSQAKGRFIFGGNVEVVLRSERDGFRMGHELRVNTDLEYVLFPRSMTAWREVFAILESNFIRRGTGRIAGGHAPGGNSTEYFRAGCPIRDASEIRHRGKLSAAFSAKLDASAPRRADLLVGIRLLY